MNYTSVRPLITKKRAEELGFKDNEIGKNGLVVTNPKDFNDQEISIFKKLLITEPSAVPEIVKEFLKKA